MILSLTIEGLKLRKGRVGGGGGKSNWIPSIWGKK